MDKLYEVNITSTNEKKIYISAPTAEDAGRIAETLYRSGVLDIDSDTDVVVEAVAVTDDGYYTGHIAKDNGGKPPFCKGDECKDCELFAIFNSIFPQEKTTL